MTFWNDQKHLECQLVSLWNAAIYYDIKVPDRYGKEYMSDCKKAKAINGGCIEKDHVIKKLNLKPVRGYLNWMWIKGNCPVEFSIFFHRGYHSVLAVDVDLIKRKLLVANYARGRLYWLTIERLIQINNRSVYPVKWVRR